jgi:hypothetical protein
METIDQFVAWLVANDRTTAFDLLTRQRRKAQARGLDPIALLMEIDSAAQ